MRRIIIYSIPTSYNYSSIFLSYLAAHSVLVPESGETKKTELLFSGEEKCKVMESQNKGKGLMASQDLPKKLTALVVDDDKLDRKIYERLLNKVGVEYHAVENGKEAVDIHCSGQSFDLIIMDMDMPIMNGIEATKKLRSMGNLSMIVGVSSSSKEAEMQEFMEAGLNDHHEKPLTIDMLRHLVEFLKISKINS